MTVKNIDSALKTVAITNSGLDANNEITANNITLSVLTDDDNNVIGVKLNGTATADTYFRLYLVKHTNCFGVNNMNTYNRLNNDEYAISGANSDNALAIYYQSVISSTDSGVFIKVNNGTTINNVVLYPMIRLKSDVDDTFAPYAMSNRELTQDVETLSNKVSVATLTDITKFTGTVATVKHGRNVTLTSDVKIFADSVFTSDEVVASGLPLPIPSAQMAGTIFAGILLAGSNSLRVKVSDNGELLIQAFTNGSSDIYGRITLSYIAKN